MPLPWSVPQLRSSNSRPFRGGVDVVSIDVAALDKSGAPVTGLAPDDFLIVAGKKPRRVVSADFVSSLRPPRAAANRLVPSASSNSRNTAPRTLILLVDIDQIPSGGGRVAMKSIGEYLDQLGADDRVGVMTLTDRRVAPTTDRGPAREALNQLVGTSIRMRDKEMTFGEAPASRSAIATSLMAYWYRIADQGSAMPGDRCCTPPPEFDRILTVPQKCVEQAEFALERVRMHTRRVLARLSAIADAMAGGPEPKAIVLVSGGLLSDLRRGTTCSALAALTERTRVSIHSLLVEAESRQRRQQRRNEQARQHRRLRRTDGRRRGLAWFESTRLGEAATAMGRIDRELSGYYVFAFERDPTDRDGEHNEISTSERRAPASVAESRKSLTPPRPNAFASRARRRIRRPRCRTAEDRRRPCRRCRSTSTCSRCPCRPSATRRAS